ncbi:MAG TPA: response regulator transcription factor [Verrucomicrobiae bacterium]|nr:response regulator transcription factor [Verrucomicrobiae bacterium]
MAKSFKPKVIRQPSHIFIVEDHPVFREGLRQVVNREADLKVCGEAGDYEDALHGIVRLRPDLALVDISLPGKSGLDLIRKLRSESSEVKLLIVSMHDEALYADRVLRAGGDGYIMKQEDPEEIVHAIRDVLGGHIYVSEEVMESRTNGHAAKSGAPDKEKLLDHLTDTELEILELLGRGKSQQQVSKQLRLGARAVAGHRTRIRKKLKLKNDEALARYAAGWVGGDR